MPINTETLKQDLDQLNHTQLQKVVDFIDFRDQRCQVVLDPTPLVKMFTDFVEEDSALIEVGMSNYAAKLYKED